jgi:ketosteroid isomerase-like protein
LTPAGFSGRYEEGGLGSDLQAFFRRYAELFMAGDADAVAAFYTAPAVAVRAGKPVPLATRAAVAKHLAGLIEGMKGSGAASADIRGIEAMSQGDGALLATVHWELRDAEGSTLRDFRTSYQLATASDWRIISYINHDRLQGR